MSLSLDILSSPTKRFKHHRSKAKQIIKQLNLLTFKAGTQYAVVLVEPDGKTDVQVSDAFRPEIHRWVQDKDLKHMRKLSREFYKRKIEEKRYRNIHSSGRNHSALCNEPLRENYRFPLQELDPNKANGGKHSSISDSSQAFTHHDKSKRSFTLSKNSLDPPSGRFSVRCFDGSADNPVNPCDDNVSDYLKRKYSRRDGASTWRSSNSTITLHSSPELATHAENRHKQQYHEAPFVLSQGQSSPNGNEHQSGTSSLLLRPLPSTNYPKETEWTSNSKEHFLPVSLTDTDKILMMVCLAFDMLQQGICKIVCKVWIKVIEPKKQTNFPYNRGEDSKPDWWPISCRHREPDHLIKSERISVLWSILFSSRVSTAQLRAATAECANKLNPSKCAILEELFYISDMHHRMIRGDLTNSTAIWVIKNIASPANCNLILDKMAEEVKSKLGSLDQPSPTDHSRDVYTDDYMESIEGFRALNENVTTDNCYITGQMKGHHVHESQKRTASHCDNDDSTFSSEFNVENKDPCHNGAFLLCEHANHTAGLNLFMQNTLSHNELGNIQDSEKIETMLGYDPDLFLQDVDMLRH